MVALQASQFTIVDALPSTVTLGMFLVVIIMTAKLTYYYRSRRCSPEIKRSTCSAVGTYVPQHHRSLILSPVGFKTQRCC